MRLLVFGAAGKVGERLVVEALGQGHDVTAFARLGISGARHGRLQTLTGDMRDRALVERALAGQEAVLWAPGSLPPIRTERSEGVQTIKDAMERRGPLRLVFLSSLNEEDVHRRAALFSAVFLLRLFRGYLTRDAETQERYVRESALDWTIIRAGTLFDGPRKGIYRLGFGVADVPADARISYADAADFMLRQLADATYLRSTVGLFY
jgi:putative NADH-flavin reductase